jgi:phage tail-like protein
MAIFGEPLYGEGSDNTDFFLNRLVESLPANYRPEEYRDFIERLLLPSAEDLGRANTTFDLLDTFVYPESAPEDWIDWMLAEWWGWTLVPVDYPLARKRRLLSNLHRHYKRRYTIAGIRELLREFGIVAEVYDRRVFTGGYYGSFGSVFPLNVRVRVLGYEPFFSPQRTYVGGYLGGIFAHTTQQIISEDFVMDLIRWSRAAGVRFLVEWRVGSLALADSVSIIDDDEVTVN